MQTKLKAILFEKKITQKALALRVGIYERGMTDKMRGKIDFTYTEVYNICRELGIKNPLEVFHHQKEERDALTSRSTGRAIDYYI